MIERSVSSARRSGYTKAELLVVLAVIVAITVIVAVLLNGRFTSAGSLRLADAENLRQIHQGFVHFSVDYQDRYPIPGQVWRERIDLLGTGSPKWIPTSAQEILSRNTTANLYSCVVAREYVPLDILISPRERNANVKPIASYDFTAYNPHQWRYWDESFQADLELASNVSYAHLLLIGARKRLRWRNTSAPDTPILSNRGPRDGVFDAKSLTTRRDGSWAGFVVFADNSVQWLETMTPENVLYEPNATPSGPKTPDNIFAAEFNDAWPGAPLGSNDALLTFTLEVTAKQGPPFETAVIQHD